MPKKRKKTNVSLLIIEETVSRNGIFYPAEELKKAVENFEPIPLLTDHKNESKNIVGRLTSMRFDEETKTVWGEGFIVDEEISDLIKDGLLDNVSAGMCIKELAEPDDTDKYGEDVMVASDLTFVEVSTIPVPGVANASITSSEGFNISEKIEKNDGFLIEEFKTNIIKNNNSKEDYKMAEQEREMIKELIEQNKELVKMVKAKDVKEKTQPRGKVVTGEQTAKETDESFIHRDDQGTYLGLSTEALSEKYPRFKSRRELLEVEE